MSTCTCLPFQDGGPCPSCRADSTVADLERRLGAWTEVAFYLADCIAATAEGALMVKRTPKRERTRQKNLCALAHGMLKEGRLPIWKRCGRPQDVLDRLERIVIGRARGGERTTP